MQAHGQFQSQCMFPDNTGSKLPILRTENWYSFPGVKTNPTTKHALGNKSNNFPAATSMLEG